MLCPSCAKIRPRPDPRKIGISRASDVAEYLIDLNATQAALRSGYSAKTAKEQAYRLLTNVHITHAVAAGKARQLDQADLSAARVLEELRRVAFANLLDFFDAAGNLKWVHELTEAQGAALASLEVIKKNAEAGDGHIDTVHKIKTCDKLKALELLAKHFGLLLEKLEISGDADVIAILNSARRRVDG